MATYSLVSVEEDGPVPKGAGRGRGVWRGHQKPPSSPCSACITDSAGLALGAGPQP